MNAYMKEAIRQASKTMDSFDLSDCELYTTAEPCPMCAGAIKWANIRKVYYGCNIGDTDAIVKAGSSCGRGLRVCLYYKKQPAAPFRMLQAVLVLS